MVTFLQAKPYLLLLLAAPLAWSGCASPEPGTTRLSATPIGYPASPYAREISQVDHQEDIPVFVVSGRNLDPSKGKVDPFGNDRIDSPLPTLGIARVSIGEGMTSEEITEETVVANGKRGKARLKLEKVELVSLPEANLHALSEEGIARHDNPWLRELDQVLSQSDVRRVTIYVHGYNSEFITNTELAAIVPHFHARNGAMITFDWPSRGQLAGYFVDKGNASASTRQFRALIMVLAREVRAEEINIVAHSAGNPIVVNALKEIRLVQRHLTPEQLQQRYKINAVKLAAPDMDMQAFINAVYDGFHHVAKSVAVYVSSEDKALDLSSFLYRSERLGRAAAYLDGWERDTLAGVENLQMIDVTSAEAHSSDKSGHSYFHRNPWVSNDMALFALNLTPEQRLLERDEREIFWVFPENYGELVSRSWSSPQGLAP
ncbi:MAG: alpha/beta hydrolase [Verrucomicrobiota bacterium]